jgi:hypothetical protein
LDSGSPLTGRALENLLQEKIGWVSDNRERDGSSGCSYELGSAGTLITNMASRSACYFGVYYNQISLPTTIAIIQDIEDFISILPVKLTFHFTFVGATTLIPRSGNTTQHRGEEREIPSANAEGYRAPFFNKIELPNPSACNRSRLCRLVINSIPISREQSHVKAASCNRGRATREYLTSTVSSKTITTTREPSHQSSRPAMCVLLCATRHGGRIHSQTGAMPSRTQP